MSKLNTQYSELKTLSEAEFIWAGGIEDTFIPQERSPAGGKRS